MKILYDDCLDAIKNNRCSECNDFYQCSVADYIELRYEKGRADVLDELIKKIWELQSVERPIREAIGISLVGEIVEQMKGEADETD